MSAPVTVMMMCEGAGVLSAFDLVGFCLNATGRNGESVEFYDDALATLAACRVPSPTAKYYFCHNRAVALSRLKKFEQALESLESAKSAIAGMDPQSQTALLQEVDAKLTKVRNRESL